MSELPKGWAIAELQELVPAPQQNIVDGPFGSNLKASEYTTSGVPIIRLQNIARNLFVDKNIQYVSESKAEELQRHSFLAGDIAITKLGDPLGKAAIVPPKFIRGVIVADIVRLRIDESYANKNYVTYAINSPMVCKALADETKGTTRPRVNLGHIRGVKIPCAPLPEQKRIADKLDCVLGRVDACRDRLDRLPALLKRFRQSILAAATSGRLTEDWRTTRSPDEAQRNPGATTPDSGADAPASRLPTGWQEMPLGQLIHEMRNGLSPKPTEQPPGAKILRISSVRPGKVDFKDHRYLEIDQATQKQYSLEKDDLLFTRY